MPWSVKQDDRCPADKPWAVVKDDDNELEGCHESEEAATRQQAALYASERSTETPDPEPLEDTATMAEDAPPRDYAVRAQFAAASTVEETGEQTILRGYLGDYEEWAEVDSKVEGHFMERILPGAFKRTIEHNLPRLRAVYDHGLDPRFGRAPLGPFLDLSDRGRGIGYDVDLLDTSYNRDLIPGLRAGMYGSSYRFRTVQMERNRPARESDHNPQRLEERSVKELELVELGPTPFPVYSTTFAGLRSLTDEYRARQLGIDPDALPTLHTALSDGPAPASAPDTRDGAPTKFRSRQEYLLWLSKH